MNEQATHIDTEKLKKPVNTLAIVPQNRRITTLGRKAYNVMLNIAQSQGAEKESYRAPLSEIVTGIDFTSHNIELVKKHLRAMATTIVEWNSPTTDEGEKWTVCALISHATIVRDKNNQNFIEWGYAQPLRRELLSPSVFSKLSLSMLSQMHTHAGIVLYEICTRYKNVGRTSRQHWRWWLPVLTGQPNSEKQEKIEFRFFKRDCLKPAIAEVCAITDIDIELIEYKQGRSITDLQFSIKCKIQASLPLKKPLVPVDLALIKAAVDLGISEEKVEDLLSKYIENNIKQGLLELELRISKKFPSPIRDPYRYLKTILEGQAQGNGVLEVKSSEVEKVTHAQMIKKQSKLKASWLEEWLRRQKVKVIGLLHGLENDSMQELEVNLATELVMKSAHPSVIKGLKSKGWDHPLVRHFMIDYYAKAVIGDEWDKPTNDDLLNIASELALLDAALAATVEDALHVV